MSDRNLIDVVRAVKIGPFGPNALAIIGQGGMTHLTPSEAERLIEAVMASDWLARVKRHTKAEALEAAANTFRGNTYTGAEVAGRLRARAAVYREQAGDPIGATVVLPPNANKEHAEWCHWGAGCCGCTCEAVPFGTHDPSVDEERKHSI